MRDATVCKFGGSSLADAECFRRVGKIIQADKRRRFIVVSAPGRSPGDDMKITDMLLTACESEPADRQALLDAIRRKFRSIARELGTVPPEAALEELEPAVQKGRDSAASRGEHICARLLAAHLKMPYIEAADVFRFRNGAPDIAQTYENLRQMGGCGVIPGFYGSDAAGNIVTFPRGGSDISAAHVAAAVGAGLYENWTDVDGFFTADPCLVPGARHIDRISSDQARLFSYLGAGVLHYDSISPASDAGIPILVRNTFAPLRQGTLICPDARCGLPCVAARELADGRYLLSAIGLTPAMRREALDILGGGFEHCGMVCAECGRQELRAKAAKLHAGLMALACEN